MKILVTGASGFIGSKLATRLAKSGHDVIGIVHDHDSTQYIKKERVDLANTSFSLPDVEYDVVFHLAAVTPMEKNRTKIKKVNYDGTVNIFNYLKNRTKFIVYASGLGVFGESVDKIVDESTPLNPHTDYAQIRLDAQRFLEKNCKEIGRASCRERV